jgi:uncharacterized iron-regulated protein
MKSLKALVLFLCLNFTFEKPAYKLFTQYGKEATYEQLIRDASQADIVLFGEVHNNPICHWLELQVTRELYGIKKDNLILGAEMFEADNQVVLNEYLQGKITDRHFEAEAKLWNNYATDYKPLIDFAITQKLPFLATNIPRRYASMVARADIASLDSLSVEAKKWIAPLPIQVDLNLPGYKKMTQMGENMGHGTGMSASNMAKAQAVKDATMAHFIVQHWKQGKTFLHFNGSYHSDHFEGIVWYLRQQNPNLKIVTISSIEQQDISKLQDTSKGLSNYIIAIPSDMTKTY